VISLRCYSILLAFFFAASSFRDPEILLLTLIHAQERLHERICLISISAQAKLPATS
jgi:hypothetical protein